MREAAQLVDRWRYHAAAGAVAAGVLLAEAPTSLLVACAAVIVLGLLIGRARTGVVCAVLAVAGGLAGDLRLRAIDAPSERLEPYSRIDARAVLLERPRSGSLATRAAVRLRTGPARGATLLAVVDGSWPGPRDPGAELDVRGTARSPASAGDGEFDWPAHLRRRGISYELHASRILATGGRRGGIAGVIDAARRRAEQLVSVGLAPEHGALLRGMVLGQDEAIDTLTRDDWRDAGLAHLLAVSGQNVMLLCALALPLLALAGASPRMRVAWLIALIALYVPLAGAGPSLQRAAVMGGAGLVALAASRPASATYGLLLAATATLLVNPRVAGDPGWQLSFAAVAGILVARPLSPRGALAGALWLTTVATLATTPLLALHFEAVPVVSVPANLAALPAVAPLMWIGMLDAAFAQLTVLGAPGSAVAKALASVLALLAAPLLAWLDAVAARTASVPYAVAEVRLPGAGAVVAAYAVLALVGCAVVRLHGRIATVAGTARASLRGRPRWLLALALAAGTATVVFAARVVTPTPPGRLTVSFLDVGQGDATLIQHPDGGAVLFDGGRPEARVARLLSQAGVRRLALLVATHASADHHGGLREVVRRFPVDVLLDGGDGTADPTFRALLADARARGARVISALAGQTLWVGDLSVRILSPEPRPPGPAPADPNPRAVVAVVSSGRFDLLLSADAESPTLSRLALPDVEAMKVPHHGSDDPGLGDVLRVARPEVAVIEVGENDYGHPHPDTLAVLRDHVPAVRRTDRDGTVQLTIERGRMSLD